MLEPRTCRQEGGVRPGAAAAVVTSSGTEGQDQAGMPAGHLPSVLWVSSKSSSTWDSLGFTVTSGCLCGSSGFQGSLLGPSGPPWNK